MMIEGKPQRLGTYRSYLLYKHVIDVLREKSSTQREIAQKLGIDTRTVWHVMQALTKQKVVSIERYDMTNGKRGVYRLDRDE